MKTNRQIFIEQINNGEWDEAAKIYGFISMPDPATLSHRQMEILGGIKAALNDRDRLTQNLMFADWALNAIDEICSRAPLARRNHEISQWALAGLTRKPGPGQVDYAWINSIEWDNSK